MANRPKTLVLKITGMTCPACERRIETAVSRLPGVSSCRASYTRGQAEVVDFGHRLPGSGHPPASRKPQVSEKQDDTIWHRSCKCRR